MMLFTYFAQVDIKDIFTPAGKFDSLASIINLLSRAVAIGGGFMVIFGFTFAAYLYISSNGDTKNIEKSKTVLTYSIIGMIVIAVSYWLTQIIAGVLGQSF